MNIKYSKRRFCHISHRIFIITFWPLTLFWVWV